jgi:argininosuccinate lyase
MVVMKGLPLTYSKDMQEDKEPAFDAIDSLSLAIAAMTGMAADMQPDTKRMAAAAGSGYSTATDLADWLVRVLAMPFRQAHHVTGTLVAMAEDRNVALDQLSLADMQSVEPGITAGIFSVLTPEASARSRTSFGGTAPANVKREAKRWLKHLG